METVFSAAHAVHMKGLVIESKMYSLYLCGDLKVVSLLMGLQQGYTHYVCFLCELDSQRNGLAVKMWQLDRRISSPQDW